ncbi:MAG: TetR/AcrR family transcriptional regulator [Verrucomicrobiota bacterium]
MAPPPNTKAQIIRSAIDVLQTHGTEGLTMRKVAGLAEMSLGNLQYHFKSKTSLMAGLAEHYFGECANMLDGYQHAPINGSAKEKLYQFVFSLLSHVDHVDQISDMCRVFREMWALSARDAEIHRQLVDYYRLTVDKLTALLLPISSSEESATHMASLILPYIEGYSITCEALPMQKEETAFMLTKLCSPFLQNTESTATASG